MKRFDKEICKECFINPGLDLSKREVFRMEKMEEECSQCERVAEENGYCKECNDVERFLSRGGEDEDQSYEEEIELAVKFFKKCKESEEHSVAQIKELWVEAEEDMPVLPREMIADILGLKKEELPLPEKDDYIILGRYQEAEKDLESWKKKLKNYIFLKNEGLYRSFENNGMSAIYQTLKNTDPENEEDVKRLGDVLAAIGMGAVD